VINPMEMKVTPRWYAPNRYMVTVGEEHTIGELRILPSSYDIWRCEGEMYLAIARRCEEHPEGERRMFRGPDAALLWLVRKDAAWTEDEDSGVAGSVLDLWAERGFVKGEHARA
jgi:hypothetical protein